ncbi:MAG: winged helix-turn-helix transcriptional regulator [Betaproteobacteria bacterium]|nr:winged helix-turn-helix transcriptional regulator [Betaproteobacteria bacterium]PWB64664.1 MAG: ArsR family transcriptional regulator [Betaproteobacteria bacterium]
MTAKQLYDRTIDATDRRILAELQRNGRITNVELAGRCHLSPAACLVRVRALEQSGYIQGYRAILDPAKLGQAMVVFVEIRLDRTTSDAFKRFASAVAGIPEIVECHMVAGGFDYLIKVRVESMAVYRDVLTKVLVELPAVRETHTFAVIEEVKNDPTIHLPLARERGRR